MLKIPISTLRGRDSHSGVADNAVMPIRTESSSLLSWWGSGASWTVRIVDETDKFQDF